MQVMNEAAGGGALGGREMPIYISDSPDASEIPSSSSRPGSPGGTRTADTPAMAGACTVDLRHSPEPPHPDDAAQPRIPTVVPCN
ncbi:hypothetical protein FOA52_008308 [Chlamydomonas sp. UWO 241]|nr:hypothetical protein FOA52_008308 [Chlamydomonas sp. UWO 241]